ncbi:hypothetical protein GGR57DRAFT_428662 [Xylariaceae sp. FL1272]|nr:hypothetical protein GGR57DRAFT_428662 [Xylariaceae sp. FL1272]
MFSRRNTQIPDPSNRCSRSPQCPRQEVERDCNSAGNLLGDRLLMELEDMDAHRPTIRIGARKASKLIHIAWFLKRRLKESSEAIPRGSCVEFFSDGEKLFSNDIPKDVHILRYRIISDSDDQLFTIIWREPKASLCLCQQDIEAIRQDINTGLTVGQVRQRVAKILQNYLPADSRIVIEPAQVTIEAIGGLRSGPLQGDSWELKNIQQWYCRRLRIGLQLLDEYFILRGFNVAYILQASRHYGTISGYSLKVLFKHKVLTTTHRKYRHYCDAIEPDDITLYHHNEQVRDNTRLHPGMTLDFELSRRASRLFLQEEAWLVPLTETCSICADDKRVSEMPHKRLITAHCSHTATACNDCVAQWITSSMETVPWDRLKCPECPALFTFANVKKFATRDTFKRYDQLATRAALDSVTGFRWCLNARCDAGQIYPLGCSKARCHACSQSSCVHHDIPWHNGETCEQYDKRTTKQRRSDKLSEKHVQKTTKPCPGCRKNVHKFSGCDHITCICGHEWCWLCFSPYTRDNNLFLRCRHKEECQYFANPPMFEGGRAFAPFLDIPPPPRARPPLRPFPIPVRPAPRAAEDRQGAQRPRDDDMLDFIFGDNELRPGRRRLGQPTPRQVAEFLNEAMMFQLAQIVARAR